ncbi:C2H2 and C2HC zinc fingers superfamily protein [Hibiscus syriacus]|uniref:C2H2 and C2HC zinc fingers superfamily protein n=1 Tax=Hibiscus syriacus TaxID=106335 RepID=A0A6A2YCJ5_HIBSY|nr:C2H2 and C2HC zinc fingers superfamily protein [Hibiscus syriacus]
MKFTDSPVVELQSSPNFRALAPPLPTTTGTNNPYSELLDFHSLRLRAIELGTGCGASGMPFILLGLHDIILTDISPVMPALKRNKPVLGKNLKNSVLYWNKEDQIRAANPPFDLVIAADVVYIEESVGHLVGAMEALVADDEAVLLGYQLRSPEADKLFWEMCENVFVIDKVPNQDLHPDYAYETDVYVFRKKNSD